MEWKRSAAMPSRLLDVMLPRAANARAETIVDVTYDTRGHAHHQRARRHDHPFRHHRAGGHHAAGADADVVQEDAAHPDETFVLDRAGVEDHAVPHADARADQR